MTETAAGSLESGSPHSEIETPVVGVWKLGYAAFHVLPPLCPALPATVWERIDDAAALVPPLDRLLPVSVAAAHIPWDPASATGPRPLSDYAVPAQGPSESGQINPNFVRRRRVPTRQGLCHHPGRTCAAPAAALEHCRELLRDPPRQGSAATRFISPVARPTERLLSRAGRPAAEGTCGSAAGTGGSSNRLLPAGIRLLVSSTSFFEPGFLQHTGPSRLGNGRNALPSALGPRKAPGARRHPGHQSTGGRTSSRSWRFSTRGRDCWAASTSTNRKYAERRTLSIVGYDRPVSSCFRIMREDSSVPGEAENVAFIMIDQSHNTRGQDRPR